MEKKDFKKYIIIFSIIILYYIIEIENIFPANLFKFIIIGLLASLSLILMYIVNKEDKIYKKFFYIASFIGIILIIIIPVLKGTDEGAHFFKTYSIFNKIETVKNENGNLFYRVPKNILVADSISSYSDEILLFKEKINNNNLELTNRYLGISLYSGLAYITYLLPMFICQKLLNMGIVSTILIGRLCSFIIWLLISTYTIKIVPKRKEFFAFLCLMPINLTLVTTYTGDLVTNSSILLFIAYWYRLYYEKRQIKVREIIIITILGILSACSKIIYALIFFIVIFLPNENFKNKKHKLCVTLFIIISILIIGIINLLNVSGDLLEAYPKIEEQKQWIFNNIFEYICVFFRTVNYQLDIYMYQFTTGDTTMLQNKIIVSECISIIYLFILIYSLISEKVNNKINKKMKYMLIIITAITIITIFTSLYLQWTATTQCVGADLIYGVQGRYFFPLVALLAFLNTTGDIKINKNYLWNGAIIINFIILLKILIRF